VPDAERLRRLAWLMLAPSLGSHRRLRSATAAANAAAGAADPMQTLVAQVLRAAGGRTGWIGNGRGNEAARELAALPPAARIAYVLVHGEGLTGDRTAQILRSAGVADPDTAIALADKSGLAPEALANMQLPPDRRPATRRVIITAAVAAVLGIAAPVIAVTTGGSSGSDRPADTSNSHPLDTSGRGAPARSTPPSATPASVWYELTQLLERLDARLATDHDPADRKRLETLRDAVAARLAKLSG
jgi:hypothetical protein